MKNLRPQKIKPGDLVKLRCSENLAVDFYYFDGTQARVELYSDDGIDWERYYSSSTPLLYLGVKDSLPFYKFINSTVSQTIKHLFLWKSKVYYITLVEVNNTDDALERTFKKVYL